MFFSDLFLSSRPRIGLATTYMFLGTVEARSVTVKKTTTTSSNQSNVSVVFCVFVFFFCSH